MRSLMMQEMGPKASLNPVGLSVLLARSMIFGSRLGSFLTAGLTSAVILLAVTGPAVAGDVNGADGQWSGEMTQFDVSGNSEYPMRLSLSGNFGETAYPSLNCGGKLAWIGDGHGHRIFAETIAYGRASPDNPSGCIDGIVTVKVHSKRLVLIWSGSEDDVPYAATAVLERTR